MIIAYANLPQIKFSELNGHIKAQMIRLCDNFIFWWKHLINTVTSTSLKKERPTVILK